MQSMQDLKRDLRTLASPKRADILQRFFKTGPGQYGEGDIFLGITVPLLRNIVKKYKHIQLKYVKRFLDSNIHEERLVSLLILVQRYNDSSDKEKEQIVRFYLDNTKHINNWDLVDLSAPNILGSFLKEKKDRSLLYKLAKSENLWERRIAIIATLSLIRNNEFRDTLQISEILLLDEHELIQKAVGWMLREVGKRNAMAEETFLKKRYRSMPRTMLRYAIERFPENKRHAYLKDNI